MERFNSIDLHSDTVPNYMMSTIFAELIRKFNEALNENPGEHFMPRDVIYLMVAIMLAKDGDEGWPALSARCMIYDPCCGSGLPL